MSLWKNHIYRRLLFAHTLSTFGDWFDMTAMAVLLGYVWHVSPLTLSLLPLVYALPGIFFGQFAGVYADRMSKKKLLLITDLISAALTALLAVAPNLPLLFLLVAARSSVSLFHAPAQQALTRQIVSETFRLQASTWNSTVTQLGKIVGPITGGLLIAAFSPQICFLINAGSFFLSSLVLMTLIILPPEPQEPLATQKQKPAFFTDWREGWTLLLQNKVLFFGMLYSLFGFLILQLIDGQYPIIMRAYDPNSPQLMGLTIGVIGFSSVLTLLVCNRRPQVIAYGRVLGTAYVACGFLGITSGLMRPDWSWTPILLCCLVCGVGSGLLVRGSNALLNQETSVESMGRVLGIYNSLVSAVLILAPVSGGALIEALGASHAFLLVGCLLAGCGVIGLLIPKAKFSYRQPVIPPQAPASAHAS